MADINELKAAQAATAANLEALTTNVSEINTGVVGIDAEVKALIALIQANPNVPQDVVDAANALSVTSGSLVAQTQSVEDQIAQIPPAPAQG